MDQNAETPITQGESEIPAAQEVIDVQATQVGEPVSVPVDSTPYPEANYAAPPAKNNNGWIIAIVVLMVVCCCCIILFVPLLFVWNILGSIFTSVYQVILEIVNGIFGGTIRFY